MQKTREQHVEKFQVFHQRCQPIKLTWENLSRFNHHKPYPADGTPWQVTQLLLMFNTYHRNNEISQIQYITKEI